MRTEKREGRPLQGDQRPVRRPRRRLNTPPSRQSQCVAYGTVVVCSIARWREPVPHPELRVLVISRQRSRRCRHDRHLCVTAVRHLRGEARLTPNRRAVSQSIAPAATRSWGVVSAGLSARNGAVTSETNAPVMDAKTPRLTLVGAPTTGCGPAVTPKEPCAKRLDESAADFRKYWTSSNLNAS